MTSTVVPHGPNAQLGYSGARHLVPDRLPSASSDRAVVLRVLDLDDDVKANIRRMAQHLRQIDLSDLHLGKLDPALVENLARLQSLNVTNNDLADGAIPAAVAKLDRLDEFVGHDNYFTKIPKALSKLKQLKRLMLSNNRIENLEGLEKLHALQLLVADDNKLRELPKDIWQNVSQIEVLKLARNKLPTLGAGIRQLKHLREIDVSGNRLTTLPAELFTLPGLEVLTAANNRLSRLPSIEGRRLKTRQIKCSFDLSDNQITRFPDCLLYGAERLDLSNNKIRRLPPDALTQLQQSGLVRLNLAGNQIVDPPQAVCDGGVTALLQHVAETKISKKVYYGAKVLVFGPQGSGKTSLVLSMMDEDSRLTSDDEQTSGVELYEVCRIAQARTLSGEVSEERPLLLNVWDFSWKLSDLALHRHFLHKCALVLFVYDVSRMDDAAFSTELNDGLNWLLTCSGDCTILPVGTQRDLVESSTDDTTLTQLVDAIIERHTKKRLDRIQKVVNEIETKIHLSSAMAEQLKAYRKLLKANVVIYPSMVVSSKSMAGFSALFKQIEYAVTDEAKFPNTLAPVPAMWVEVERYLEERCASLPMPLVSVDNIKDEIVKRFGMKHIIRQILQYLSDNGKILLFNSQLSRKEMIVLKPTWFLDIARSVFRDKSDFDGDYQLEQRLKAAGASMAQFHALLEFMREHGTLERAYLQCIWDNSLPSRSNAETYEHCLTTLATMFLDYFEIAFVPPAKRQSMLSTEKFQTKSTTPKPPQSAETPRVTNGDNSTTDQQPNAFSESTADDEGKISELKKTTPRKVISKRRGSTAKTSSSAKTTSNGKRRNSVSEGSSGRSVSELSLNTNGHLEIAGLQISSADDADFRLYVPQFFASSMSTACRETYSRFAGNLGIAAVFSFPYYHPPHLYETMMVRSQSGKHAFEVDYYWQDGLYARCTDAVARFCLSRLVHDDGVACFRVEVRHETTKSSDEDDDVIKCLWRILLQYLGDVEALLLNYPGLYVERYIECPRCTALSFSGEWQTPKDLQAVSHKTCEDCGEHVSASLLIQPLEKKKIEEFLRQRLLEKSRRRSMMEVPTDADNKKMGTPPSPLSSDNDDTDD